MAYGYDQGLASATGRVEFYIIMALVSAIVLVLCRSKRVAGFIANHPQHEGSVNFLNYTAMLMNFTMCWMLFIFGVLNIGVTVASAS